MLPLSGLAAGGAVDVHERPPWPLSRTQLVEKANRMFASGAREVAVMPVDHGQARPHVAGEVEGGDAGTERERREGVSEILDPAQGLDSRGERCGLPVAVAEVVQASSASLQPRSRSYY
jgi:hypothetical protein